MQPQVEDFPIFTIPTNDEINEDIANLKPGGFIMNDGRFKRKC